VTSSYEFRKKVFGDRFGSRFNRPRGVGFFLHRGLVSHIILAEAKRKRQIVYGTMAMNRQLPLALQRRTQDYDIYTRNPRQTAHKMQLILDREIARGDEFFSTPAYHRGTYRVKHEGPDQRRGTPDDVDIADYSKTPRKLGTVRINGLRWETLASIEQGKQRILRDPKSKYRHKKDRGDLARIRAHKLLRRLLG